MTDIAMSCLPVGYSTCENEVRVLLQEFTASHKDDVLKIVLTAYPSMDMGKAKDCAETIIRRSFISAANEVGREPASSQAILIGGCIAGAAAGLWQLLDHSGEAMRSFAPLMGYIIAVACIAGSTVEMLATHNDKKNKPANDSLYLTPDRRDAILKGATDNLDKEMKKFGCLNFGS